MRDEAAVSLMAQLAARARVAGAGLPRCSTGRKRDALSAAAQAIERNADAILSANAHDVGTAKAKGLSSPLVDRLSLDAQRLDAMIATTEKVATLPDPVGSTIRSWTQPNGLRFERIRVPIGTIGMIYESGPHVTSEAAALCVMSGNAVILRGGSEAVHSNQAIQAAFVKSIDAAGISTEAVQLVSTQDRAVTLRATGMIDLVIPRGGKGLVARIIDQARVPVLAHLEGNCHVYVDAYADPKNAKS